MTTHHPKFSIHIALWLVGLTTKILLPTALIVTVIIVTYMAIMYC